LDFSSAGRSLFLKAQPLRQLPLQRPPINLQSHPPFPTTRILLRGQIQVAVDTSSHAKRNSSAAGWPDVQNTPHLRRYRHPEYPRHQEVLLRYGFLSGHRPGHRRGISLGIRQRPRRIGARADDRMERARSGRIGIFHWQDTGNFLQTGRALRRSFRLGHVRCNYQLCSHHRFLPGSRP